MATTTINYEGLVLASVKSALGNTKLVTDISCNITYNLELGHQHVGIQFIMFDGSVRGVKFTLEDGINARSPRQIDELILRCVQKLIADARKNWNEWFPEWPVIHGEVRDRRVPYLG